MLDGEDIPIGASKAEAEAFNRGRKKRLEIEAEHSKENWHGRPHREKFLETSSKIEDGRESIPEIQVEERSYLTTKDTLHIWKDICGAVWYCSGLTWQHKTEDLSSYSIDPIGMYIYVPEGDVEALVHDMCHYFVSSSSQKKLPNLGLDKMSVEEAIKIEESTWALESFFFQQVMSQSELMEWAAPGESQAQYWEGLGDTVNVTINALGCVKNVKDEGVRWLRRSIAKWKDLIDKDRPATARPRGCCRWNGFEYRTIVSAVGKEV